MDTVVNAGSRNTFPFSSRVGGAPGGERKGGMEEEVTGQRASDRGALRSLRERVLEAIRCRIVKVASIIYQQQPGWCMSYQMTR